MTEEKKVEIREQVEVIFLAAVLVMSGLLLVKQKNTPETFTESKTTASSSSSDGATTTSSQSTLNSGKINLVNINKAGPEELDTLLGVGSVKYEQIKGLISM
jgi:DNA uptake protein ComE-like DNA-binding protein